MRNAREPGHQRGFPRIRQHDRARVAVARKLRASARRARARSKRAVRRRGLDDAADAAHARVDRRAPGGREHVDDRRPRADRAPARPAARTGWRRRSTRARRSGCAPSSADAPRRHACRGHVAGVARQRAAAQCRLERVRQRAGIASRNTGTSPRRSPRCRGRRADATTTAASADWGRTTGRSGGRPRPAAHVAGLASS